jgi:hypothetical protein
MGTLSSKFTREEIETLIESMSEWEASHNEEWYIMDVIKKIPMPPEDHEAYEMWQKVKEHFRQREKKIEADRFMRQEKTVFIKAKLMLVRKDMDVDQLFALATSSEEDQRSLADIEEFIRDLGVWDHYQRFLQDKENSQKE